MSHLLSARLLRAMDNKTSERGKKYTAYRLSKDTGLDNAYVHRVLEGKHTPSRDVMAKLCEALKPGPQEKMAIYHAAGYLTPEELEEEERGAPAHVA